MPAEVTSNRPPPETELGGRRAAWTSPFALRGRGRGFGAAASKRHLVLEFAAAIRVLDDVFALAVERPGAAEAGQSAARLLVHPGQPHPVGRQAEEHFRI